MNYHKYDTLQYKYGPPILFYSIFSDIPWLQGYTRVNAGLSWLEYTYINIIYIHLGS